ncbi:MAG: ATP-binding cassette domain-containing protein [Cyanobacteria bacterium J06631_9]
MMFSLFSKAAFKNTPFSILSIYWRSAQKWGAWSLLGLLIFLLLIRTGLQVVFLIYGGELTSALAAKDSARFFQAVTIFAGILVISVPFASLSGYIRDKLGLYWRTWMTQHTLTQYLGVDNAGNENLDASISSAVPYKALPFYHLRLLGTIENPDQRIEEDVRSLTQGSLKVFEIATEATFQLIGFAGLLWSISQPLMLFLLAYSVIGSLLAAIGFGKPLIRLNTEQLSREAGLRYELTHIRDNKEAIALYQGEPQELTRTHFQFDRVFQNFKALIRWQLGFNLFQNHYRYASFIIPGMVLAPRLFAGELEIGDVTQAGSAFTLILSALALIVLQLQQITSIGAAIGRLQQLFQAISSLQAPANPNAAADRSAEISQPISASISATNKPSGITLTAGHTLSCQALSLLTPDNSKVLIQDLTFTLPPDKSLLIMGESGVGKSSLVRAITGLWIKGKGHITRPQSMTIISQRPYLPNISFKALLLYPQLATNVSISDESIYQMLAQVNLPKLQNRPLDQPLDKRLSPGEQQRLAFARLLLQPTKYVILDEATSALDIQNETHLYKLLQQAEIIPISISHRPSTKHHHNFALHLLGNSCWQYGRVSKMLDLG